MNISEIKGIIFDYGGTLDSNGKHWAEVLWDAYTDNQIPVEKQAFRDAYVYGERYLAKNPVIQSDYTFMNLLQEKIRLQINWLIENGFLSDNDKTSSYLRTVSEQCYNFARSTVHKTAPILEQLAGKYPLVLVSNFYGNVEAVLNDFNIVGYFKEIVESSVVGIRKPDPAIFALGVKALNLHPEEVIVIGDSHKKDIIPAQIIGCKTIWLKGPGWEEDNPDLPADIVIQDFVELRNIFFTDN